MKPAAKYTLWTLGAVAMLAAMMAPRLLTIHAQEARAAPMQREGRNHEGGPPLAVSAIVVRPVKLAETVTSTGTLRAEEGVELQAEINGKVVAIDFFEGARVSKGDLLVKLNDADLRATLARALHRKRLAVLREQRVAQLLKQGVARQEEYDTALNELNVQDAETALTEAQIAKTEIRAPFDGVVGLRYVSEGAFINAATRVATLQRLDKLKVDFSVAEKYAGRVAAGAAITFTVAGADTRYKGEVYAIDPRIDAATRTVLLRAICPNPAGRLLPGAFANVEMTLSQLDDAILVPSVAVIAGLNEKNVFVVSNGRAQRRSVQTGTRMESTVQILSGLAPGDIVITSGLQQMRAGLPVRVAGET